MDNHKKLQVFVFSDTAGWSFPQIQAEAMNAAVRRAEMMGWSEISVKPVSTVPEIEGKDRNYWFEIWGLGESLIDSGEESKSTEAKSTTSPSAAREADL